MKLARPPIPPKKRAVRAVVKRFRRLGIKTSKQNNFQFLLRKIWRAGVKKLKENCFALLAEFRRAETRSGANRAFSVQSRFALRSAIATEQSSTCPVYSFAVILGFSALRQVRIWFVAWSIRI